MKRWLVILLFISLVVHLFFAFRWHEVWWDSGVYVGMGKYVWSGGQAGLWEHIRPPLWPLVLGFFWKLGLSPVLFGRLFEILLSLGMIWLTYELASRWFTPKTGLLAAMLIAWSPIFFYLSFHQYTEVPSTFLILLAIYFFEQKKLFWAGLGIGFAFLTKYPAGIFVAILGLVLLIRRQSRNLLPLGFGFLIPTGLFFASNFFLYGSLFEPLRAAQDAIARALGCNVLHYHSWWYYFWLLIFSETKLHLFSLVGIFSIARQWKARYLTVLLSFVIPLLYFVPLHCRDYRYLTLILPFVACLTAYGLAKVCEMPHSVKARRRLFVIVALIVFLLTARTALRFYLGNEPLSPNPVIESYLSFSFTPSGEVWTANPILAAYTDTSWHKLYYPIYGSEVSADFKKYVNQNVDQISHIFVDNCGGGLVCPPTDANCMNQTEELLFLFDQRFKRVFDAEQNSCWYRIYARG